MSSLRRPEWLVLLCLSVAFVWGCKLDGNKVEASIHEKFSSDGVELTSIECPDDRALSAGDTFDCKGISGGGDPFLVHVTQKDAQGSVSWKYDGVVVDPTKVAKGAFDCGDKKFIAVEGTKMTCKLRDKTVEIVFTDDKGSFDKALLGELVAP